MNLVTALLHAEWPKTRDELRSGLREYYSENDETFRRQFERDKDELRSMGIPLLTASSPNHDPPVTGYRIDRKRYRGKAPDLDTRRVGCTPPCEQPGPPRWITGRKPVLEVGGASRQR